MRGYIRNTEFKDPVTSEMKSLMNLRDVNDFWNWHEVNSLGGGVNSSLIEHLSICASTRTYAHNAQTRTSMHLRNHTIAPACKHQYLLFPMMLMDKEYGGAPVPANKSGTILLHNRLVGDIRCECELETDQGTSSYALASALTDALFVWHVTGWCNAEPQTGRATSSPKWLGLHPIAMAQSTGRVRISAPSSEAGRVK